MNSKLIITGASGFLGFHVLKDVCRKGQFTKVAAITRHVGALEKRVEHLPGNSIVELYHTDAIKAGEFHMDADDIVLHCAYPRALKGVDVTSGIDYAEALFRASESAGIKGIVNISSQSVYDPQRVHPATEEDTPSLSDAYAIGKYYTEVLLKNICSDIPHTSVRLASLIGPSFSARVPNKMIKSALDNGVIHVEVNEQRFGYLDVEDAARGLIKLLSVDPIRWEAIYNLGIDGTYSLEDIAESIQKMLLETKSLPVAIEKHSGQSASNSALCNNRIKRLIGEFVQNTLDTSIQRIILSMN